MKFFAVFSALLAVALAAPNTWTLDELSAAIQNPSTDPALIPALEQALNELMLAIVSGSPQEVIAVATPVQDLSSWTLNELSLAIQNPATDAALLPYLEDALNTMMDTIMAGNQPDFIIVATPVGLLPTEAVMDPSPPAPVTPVIVPGPVGTPVAPLAPSSPLVQIIVNVKSQEAVAPAPVSVPEVLPVVPSPVVLPAPVAPEVVPSPVVLPQPVLPVVNPGVNPVDIIAINPVVAVNPVDIMSPLPVVAPVNVVDGIMA